ncbi:Glutamate synthase [NADPH] large chain [hydrothermal vent metagenome]|uniref:Glutamate synthase [NADPH] large chain n=1 Tax=hydrothermal vent metagenome TaxID=652676 RepID=A0A3B1E6Z6_9ZZZZ
MLPFLSILFDIIFFKSTKVIKLNSHNMYPITLDGNSVKQKRKEIKKYFNNTFNIYEKIFEVLKDDSVFYKQSEITRHPMIFYFGHTAAFFINKLIYMNIISTRVNSDFESLFAVGVDEMSWDDTNSLNYNWPKVNDVRKYRSKVKDLVNDLVDTLPLVLPITKKCDMWVILMGIEHERIHIETSLVLHRQMPLKFIKEIDDFRIDIKYTQPPENELIDIKQTKITLGKNNDNNYYGWDNEYGTYTKVVDNFKVSKYLVSNAEYLQYIKETSAPLPHFWVLKGKKYYYRTLTSIIPLPLSYPVDINAIEAEAFCEYKSKQDDMQYSLPSEAQYKAICKYGKIDNLKFVDDENANHNFVLFHSCVINKYNFNGIYDLVGNVWQWSSTPIFGFDGFKTHNAYDDFSTPTFDGKHSLLLGSSWASSGNLIMNSSRYAFRKHFYQNAGFRYVVSKKQNKKLVDIYESDELVSQYCEFQYGNINFNVKNFAIQCAKIASKYTINKTKALDLGCATGRTTFELAKTFNQVEGVDFSASFIQVGSNLKNDGYIVFKDTEEAKIFKKKKITLAELGYTKIKDKVAFWQGDACNLKSNFNSYDMILATNLIDRLYNPYLFLNDIDKRLNKNGILILTSPYTWQESSTKKEFWLGGYKDINGNDIRTIDTLKKVLNNKFKLLHTQDLEFVIKETKRKYQHTISHVTVWQKKI